MNNSKIIKCEKGGRGILWYRGQSLENCGKDSTFKTNDWLQRKAG
jgi:hypothetical protein